MGDGEEEDVKEEEKRREWGRWNGAEPMVEGRWLYSHCKVCVNSWEKYVYSVSRGPRSLA